MEDIEIMLGDDDDCETCGYSFNRAELRIDDEEVEWLLMFATGCYGGESVGAPHFERAFTMLDWYEKSYPVDLNEIRGALETLQANG